MTEILVCLKPYKSPLINLPWKSSDQVESYIIETNQICYLHNNIPLPGGFFPLTLEKEFSLNWVESLDVYLEISKVYLAVHKDEIEENFMSLEKFRLMKIDKIKCYVA
jgi:hypothetical protein